MFRVNQHKDIKIIFQASEMEIFKARITMTTGFPRIWCQAYRKVTKPTWFKICSLEGDVRELQIPFVRVKHELEYSLGDVATRRRFLDCLIVVWSFTSLDSPMWFYFLGKPLN